MRRRRDITNFGSGLVIWKGRALGQPRVGPLAAGASAPQFDPMIVKDPMDRCRLDGASRGTRNAGRRGRRPAHCVRPEDTLREELMAMVKAGLAGAALGALAPRDGDVRRADRRAGTWRPPGRPVARPGPRAAAGRAALMVRTSRGPGTCGRAATSPGRAGDGRDATRRSRHHRTARRRSQLPGAPRPDARRRLQRIIGWCGRPTSSAAPSRNCGWPRPRRSTSCARPARPNGR